MSKNMGLTVASAVFLVSSIFLAFHLMQPPDAVPLDAPLNEFSSGRAMRHLKNIAARPHPLGSPEHGKVRDHIVSQLTALGFEPEIQTAEVMRYRSQIYATFATVNNILIRIPGTGSSKALLLSSHYDSVPNAPGATDDGSGVVVMLETLRALKHHPKPKNDIIFLFSDGEELSLLGAKAFVEQHPWAEDVGLVLNFDSSGSRGQALMFETSNQNRWLIEEFAKVVPYPAANSLSYEVYRRMPNDTDLSIFKNAGVAGLNFAYIDGRPNYHTFNDNIANIDERSIQHMGSYALALTNHFSNLTLDENPPSNAVYFNTIGTGFVYYSESWVIPLLILAVALFAAVTFLGFRAAELTFMGIIKGFLAFLLVVITGPTLISSLYGIINGFFVDSDWWLLYYNNKALLSGFVLLTVAVCSVLFVWFRDGVRSLHSAVFGACLLLFAYFGGILNWQSGIAFLVAAVLLKFSFETGVDCWNLYMGALFGWLLIAGVLSVSMPGGSYLVTWPLILGLISMGILFLTNQNNLMSFKALAIFSVFAIPGILWLVQSIYLIYVAMGINMSGLTMVGVALLVGLLIPHMHYLTSWNKWLVSGASTILGLVFILQVALGSEFNERFPKPNTLFYAYNANSDETFWASTDQQLDSWTSQYIDAKTTDASLSEILPTSAVPMHRSPAPRIDIAAPKVDLLKDDSEGEVRTLQFRIASARHASYLNLFFHPESKIQEASINGMQVEGIVDLTNDALNNWWRWRYFGLPTEGVDLTLKVRSNEAIEIRAVDISYGLPRFTDASFKPRPDNMIPRRYTLSEMTIAARTYVFEGDSLSRATE